MRFVAALLFLVLAFAAGLAHAQESCLPRERLATQLEEKFAETPVFWGLTSKGFLMEVFASKSGSWTLVVTNAAGLSCVRGAGEAWSNLPADEAEREDAERKAEVLTAHPGGEPTAALFALRFAALEGGDRLQKGLREIPQLGRADAVDGGEFLAIARRRQSHLDQRLIREDGIGRHAPVLGETKA